jgi:hypothetical protein
MIKRITIGKLNVSTKWLITVIHDNDEIKRAVANDHLAAYAWIAAYVEYRAMMEHEREHA